jgi:succinoglycan biosynthesis protein ExoA
MNDLPLVSVVMPVRNEAVWIARSVGAVLAQDYPHDLLEVIVVVGDSTDATRAIVDGIARADVRVSVLDNPGGKTPVSVNLGIRRSRGAVVIRVDGHALVDEDFVRATVDVLARTHADGAGGVCRHVGEGRVGEAIALAMTSRLGTGNAVFRVGGTSEADTDSIMFGGYRRELFERVGVMDEALTRNQDDEFNHRVRLAGGRLVFSPAIRSTYSVRPSLRALWSQYRQYGQFRVATLVKHRRPGAARQLAPAMLVAGLAGAALVEGATLGRVPAGRRVAGSYAAALSTGAVLIARRAGKPASAPLVGLAVASMHLAYGSGFWLEVGRRVKRGAGR